MKPTLSVTIEPDLLGKVRAAAERQGRPLSWLVSDLLASGLRRQVKPAAHPRQPVGGSK